MNFICVCKVCKSAVDEKEMFSHLKEHDPVYYFDVLPVLKW